jgi:hypothetical protein
MYRLTGEPVDVSGAADLAASDSIGSMWAIGPSVPVQLRVRTARIKAWTLRHGRSTSLRTMRAAAIGGGVYWRMANSSKIDRAQHKAAAQRNRVNAVKARARKGAKKRRSARAGNAAAVKTAPKTPPASS